MVTLAELTALNVVVPVLLALIFSKAVVLPIAPLKLRLDAPTLAVMPLFPSKVELKVMLFPVKMGLLAMVTASL